MLRTHKEYNLLFGPKAKPLPVTKDTKSLKLLHPVLILVITLSTAPPLLSHQDKAFPQFQETDHLMSCLDNPVMSIFC